MDRLGSADILFFEGFRLDRAGGGLFRLDPEGIAEPVAMSSRALDLLGLLVEWHEELVSKDVIMDAVWPKTIVEEANLTVHISTLRRILDQNCDNGSCIQTMPGRGYRFIGAVTRAEPTSPPGIRHSGQAGCDRKRYGMRLACDIEGLRSHRGQVRPGYHEPLCPRYQSLAIRSILAG